MKPIGRYERIHALRGRERIPPGTQTQYLASHWNLLWAEWETTRYLVTGKPCSRGLDYFCVLANMEAFSCGQCRVSLGRFPDIRLGELQDVCTSKECSCTWVNWIGLSRAMHTPTLAEIVYGSDQNHPIKPKFHFKVPSYTPDARQNLGWQVLHA